MSDIIFEDHPAVPDSVPTPPKRQAIERLALLHPEIPAWVHAAAKAYRNHPVGGELTEEQYLKDCATVQDIRLA